MKQRMAKREFDLILFGATGFTGRLAAQELCAVSPSTLRWAVAGRNSDKLGALMKSLDGSCPPRDKLVVDGHQANEVAAMCSRTRVIATTAGPFALHGKYVPQSCLYHGTHYADITGESPWVRELVDTLHEDARRKGCFIVPFCGFDSVPADLGAAHAVQTLEALSGQECVLVRAAVKLKGGVNGGTVSTALNMAREGRSMDIANPILLNPPEKRDRTRKKIARDLRKPTYDEHLNCWIAPFVMAPINGHVVRRSHALTELYYDKGYGPNFNYQEGLAVNGSLGASKAFGIAAATIMGAAAMTTGAGRYLIDALTPAAGEGPSHEVMESGFVKYRFLAHGTNGALLSTTLFAEGDPGNRVTVVALCQSALALALDTDSLPGNAIGGGVLTPAVAFGDVLRKRLKERGFEWSDGHLILT